MDVYKDRETWTEGQNQPDLHQEKARIIHWPFEFLVDFIENLEIPAPQEKWL